MNTILFSEIPNRLQDAIKHDIETGEFFTSFYGGNWLYINNKTEAHLHDTLHAELRVYPFRKRDIEILAIMQVEADWHKAKQIQANLLTVDILKEFEDNTLLYSIKGPTVLGIRSLLQAALSKVKRDDLKKELIQACAELEEFENLVEASKIREWAKHHPNVLKQRPKKMPKKAKPTSYDFMDLKSLVDDADVERELNSLKQYIP